MTPAAAVGPMALSVSGVEKSFGGTSVLQNITLSVQPGTLFALLGASGSGKTTLLRSIAGFERIDKGSIEIAGASVDDGERFVAPERRRVGYVPQDGSLFPHLSVSQNVVFGLRRSERTMDRAEALLEGVGLGGSVNGWQLHEPWP